VQHWRTLVSVYNRSPFFFHYTASLGELYETEYKFLTDFNKAALQWVKQQLKFAFSEEEVPVFQKEYPAAHLDLRRQDNFDFPVPHYYQVFEDRIGFEPGLSILDLLFSEGPNTGKWLQENQGTGGQV
jgi:hypothetical protein